MIALWLCLALLFGLSFVRYRPAVVPKPVTLDAVYALVWYIGLLIVVTLWLILISVNENLEWAARLLIDIKGDGR